MKQPLTRGLDHIVDDPSPLEIALGLLLLLLVAAAVRALLLILKRAETSRARRWIHVPGSLGLLAVLLAVAGMALRTVVGYGRLQELGQNVVPMDFFDPYAGGFLVLATGVLVGALGLVATWVLEWIHEARSEPDPG